MWARKVRIVAGVLAGSKMLACTLAWHQVGRRTGLKISQVLLYIPIYSVLRNVEMAIEMMFSQQML